MDGREQTADLMRVVEYFDRFAESDANADTVIRAAAVLADCPAGARWPSGTTIRYDAAGRLLPVAAPPPGAFGTEPTVWLERTGAPHSPDGVLVGRLLRTPIDAEGRIEGEDSYHSGPVEIRKLTFDELPREYVELVHSGA